MAAMRSSQHWPWFIIHVSTQKYLRNYTSISFYLVESSQCSAKTYILNLCLVTKLKWKAQLGIWTFQWGQWAITALPLFHIFDKWLASRFRRLKENDYAVCLREYKRLLSKREYYLKASIGVVYVALPTRLQYCLKVHCGYLCPCMVNTIPS